MRYALAALVFLAPALSAQDRPRTGGDRPRPAAPAPAPAPAPARPRTGGDRPRAGGDQPRTGGDQPRAAASSGDAQSRFMATGQLMQAGKFTEALAASEALLRQYPNDPIAKFAVARALVAAKQDPRRAIDLLRDFRAHPAPAGTFTPGAPEWRMGQAYNQLGKNDSAVVLYEMARKLNPRMDQPTNSLDSLRRRN